MWAPEHGSALEAPPGVRWFRGTIEIPADRKVRTARMSISADNEFVLYVNGGEAGRCTGDEDGWRRPRILDIAKRLRPGTNVLAIAATNGGTVPNPAGVIGICRIEFEQGDPQRFRIDGSWKASEKEHAGWEKEDFDDRSWGTAKEVAPYGQGPWGDIVRGGGALTLSPLKPDPFLGRCTIPADVKLQACRVYLEMEELPPPETAAAVEVNGRPAGGVIGRPFRVDVTQFLQPGENTFEIVPVSPKSARLAFYPAP
jgi:hypothetical protein